MDKSIELLYENLSRAGENNISFHFHPSESKVFAEALKELLRRYDGQKRTIEILMSNKFAVAKKKTIVYGAGIA